MPRFYTNFPGGMSGIGLLILRTAAGIAAGIYGIILLSRLETAAERQFPYIGHLVLSLLLLTGSLFFILGLMMPYVSLALVLCELTAAYIRLALVNPLQGSRFSWIALLILASISISLIFLGPGAYSIDARLFGRRRIFIPSSIKEEK